MTQFWRFTDDLLNTYTLEVNPTDPGSVARNKRFGYEHRSSGGTTTILQTGADPDVRDARITTLTQAQYEALVEWMDKEDPIELRDHLLREYLIMIEEVNPDRKYSADGHFVHDVGLRFWVLEELSATAPSSVIAGAYMPNVSMTIYDLTVVVTGDPVAECATATATALDATVSIAPTGSVGAATATAAGQNATTTRTGEPQAEGASATAGAEDATVSTT